MSLLTLTGLSHPLAEERSPGLLTALVLWRQRRRTRRHLSELDDRLLADIGLSREQQQTECAKAPWHP
jgi:uncharacterized protein YjiS (DUF1127 family)